MDDSVGPQHEPIMTAELIIEPKRPFAQASIVGLERCAVVAEFCVEISAPEDSPLCSNLVSDR